MPITREFVIGSSEAADTQDIKLVTKAGTILQTSGTVPYLQILPASIPSAADDAAAAALSPAVPIGGLYRTASAVKIRVA
jgi:hypothetical protein